MWWQAIGPPRAGVLSGLLCRPGSGIDPDDAVLPQLCSDAGRGAVGVVADEGMVQQAIQSVEETGSQLLGYDYQVEGGLAV